MAYEEPTPKRFKHSIISEHIFEPELQEIFRRNWHRRTPFRNENIEIITEPFRVCKISNFLKSKDFMEELKNELIDVKTRRTVIDLYQFEQSIDLSEVDTNIIKTLYHTFQTNLSDWMQENTRIVLNETITMTSSCYADTDYLLCHDDNMGDRRIAFILYLSENWKEEYGGTLDLFDTDEDGLPRNVVKSIVPEFNSLVFFEVVHNSYHQVAEVTSPDKPRWSINGWFHGPAVLQERVERPEPVINYYEPENIEVDLSQWVSNNYLYQGTITMIHEDIEQESFTFLSSFIKESVYERLSQEIQSKDIKWRRVGPADVRNYEVADEDSLPNTLAEFYRMFRSYTIFALLKSYTELQLLPLTEDMHPRVTFELQRWSTGCYTLISDKYVNEDNVDTAPSSDRTNVDTAASSDKTNADSPSKPVLESEENLQKDNVDTAASSDKNNGDGPSKPVLESEENLQKDNVDTAASSDKNNVAGPSKPVLEREKNLHKDNTPPSSGGDADVEEDEEEAVAARRRRVKHKSPKKKRSSRRQRQQLSPPKADNADNGENGENSDNGDNIDNINNIDNIDNFDNIDDNYDRNDSEVSDIGDYLSDREDEEYQVAARVSEAPEESEEAEEPEAPEAPEESAEPVAPENSKPGLLDVIMQFNTRDLNNVTIDYVDPNEKDATLINVPCKDNHLCMVYTDTDTVRLHRYVNHDVPGYFYNLVCTYFE